MKTRQELLEQQKKLQQFHPEVEQKLLRIPGVVGVSTGMKSIAGN